MSKKIHPFIEKIISWIEHNYFVELAFDMKSFKYFVADKSYDIITSWFFLRYINRANITDYSEQKKEAANKLINHIIDISTKYYNMDRRKAIEDVIIEWDEYDHNKDNRLEWICESGIDYYLYNKITIDKNIVKQCVDDWIEYGLHDILEYLINRNYSYEDLKTYIFNI